MSFAISPITDADVEAVIALWQRCGLTRPWNDPSSDIAFVRRGANATILIGRHDNAIVATAMVGHDGHRGWLYYVASDPGSRGSGFGRQMVQTGEDWLRDRDIVKVQLLVRETNTQVVSFYEHLDYEVAPRVIMSKWLKPPA